MTRFMLSAVAATAILIGCETAQENPNYQYSTKYNSGQPTSYAGSTVSGQGQAVPVSYRPAASYQAVSNGEVDPACLSKERNRELIGGALGGAVGAFAGKEIIGGTAGTIVGAGLGGTLGYGIGDVSLNCDPVAVTSGQPSGTYQQSASTQASYSNGYTHQAGYVSGNNGFTCPAGTSAQPNGTCLLGAEPSVIAQPVQAQASYVQPSTNTQAVSPTDSYYQGDAGYGTPGYQVLQAQTYETPLTSVPQAQPVQAAQAHLGSNSQSGAQSVAYDYSENLVQANAFTVPSASETYTLGGATSFGDATSHAIVQGDTVYSLSRKLCVGVSEIQNLNGLDHNYNIKIGDSLNLPASRC